MNKVIAESRLRIKTSASGDTELVAAARGLRCRVHGLRLSVAGAVIVSIKAGHEEVLETFNFVGAGTMATLMLRFQPYYETAANEALNISLNGAVQCDGVLEYTMS